MNPDIVKKKVKRLDEYSEEYRKELNKWFQHILLISSSLFGILIALNKPDALQQYIKVYAIALALLGLGILSGAITLFLSVHVAKRKLHSYKELFLDEIRKGTSSMKSGSASIFFSISQILSYIFLSCSVLMFVGFIILNAFL